MVANCFKSFHPSQSNLWSRRQLFKYKDSSEGAPLKVLLELEFNKITLQVLWCPTMCQNYYFYFWNASTELGWMSLDLRVAQSLCEVLGPILSTENKQTPELMSPYDCSVYCVSTAIFRLNSRLSVDPALGHDDVWSWCIASWLLLFRPRYQHYAWVFNCFIYSYT